MARNQKTYSEAFKRELVELYETGDRSVRSLEREYRGSPVLVDTTKCTIADSKLVRRLPEIGSRSTNADADDYRTTQCI
jgi:transposase-like protein